ncbi:MAG TPA: tetratricopeptide repeat protein [Thermoanaerobaculia bacterium]|nr:tetratricopeptide repeat protein [Thermoanaerobaculia bacterium]
MTVSHPDPDELARFVQGDLPLRENRRIVRTLLAAWRAYRSGLGIRRGGRGILRSGQMPPVPPSPAAGYGQIFERSLLRLGAQAREIAVERGRVPELSARLDALPLVERRSVLRSDPAFRLWPFCEWLIEEGHRLIHVDLVRAEERADLALILAEELDPRAYGAPLINDIKARAWACIGEVLHILSDLRSADEAFALAESRVGEGTGDALEEARILELKAALRRDQQRTTEAHRLLDEVIAIYRQYRDFHLVGRGFVAKGQVYGAAHDLDAAVRWLRKGLGLLDPTRERHLELAARHSLMLYLHESDHHQEAWFLLKASRPEFQQHGGELLGLRLRWLEGKIQQVLGLLDDAEKALSEARAGFIAQGIGFDAASVSLDLAGLYATQGRTTEMRRLAGEMLPIFRSRDLHREAIAALIVFQQAVQMEKLTSHLLNEIRSYLRRARKDHKLRFEPSAS